VVAGFVLLLPLIARCVSPALNDVRAKEEVAMLELWWAAKAQERNPNPGTSVDGLRETLQRLDATNQRSQTNALVDKWILERKAVPKRKNDWLENASDELIKDVKARMVNNLLSAQARRVPSR